jgi:hypothetical protein
MQLTRDQKQSFYDDGYIVVPSVVPQEQIRAARKAINQSFSHGIDPARLDEFRNQSFCPELRDHPTIEALLLDNGTRDLVESLVGPGSIPPRPLRAQLAIRFPENEQAPVVGDPHLDGMYTPSNGLKPGDIWSHTMLVGIFLSDVTEDNAGNFTAWPGSHHVYEQHFRREGPQSLLAGMPDVDIGEPRQIHGRAGDVLLAHYQLGHTVGPHIGPDIRYTVFFRIQHPEHANQKWEAMTDIWKEWPGLGPE